MQLKEIIRFDLSSPKQFLGMPGKIIYWSAIYLISTFFMTAHADVIDDFITNRMQQQNITGLSLAIIQNGKIIKEQGYGFTDKSGKTRVTSTTLFQAGSISKPVAAFGALHLVEAGQLSLDANVNTELRTWKLPENEFTKDKKVTLRGILSHSAGLTVHGFPGYAINEPVPALTNVLDGITPAKTAAVQADTIPGSVWRYSGGGYTVMQQMIIDVTGKSFSEFMSHAVLKPLGMTNSTYEQPLPQNLRALTAAGYYPNGLAVSGRWHIYPEMAAAGLWTTAPDLARFAMGVQQSFTGKSNPILSPSMTRLMLTNQKHNDESGRKHDDGLGLFLNHGKTFQFWHDGRNAGFDSLMIASANAENGAVILINANDNSGTLASIVKIIAKEYNWQAYTNEN